MTALTVREAKTNLQTLVDKTATSHKPIYIKGQKDDAVLLSAKDYSGMKETLYLMSIPGMWESIERASKTPLSECLSEDDFKKLCDANE